MYFLAESYGSALYIRDEESDRKDTKFEPEIFIKSDLNSEYKTTTGVNVKKVNKGNMKEVREFHREYLNVDNVTVYGMDSFYLQYIRSKYDDTDSDYNAELIRVFNIDIEVLSKKIDEHGNEIPAEFPEPEAANHPVVAVALRDSKTGKKHIWGLKNYSNPYNYEYHQFSDEISLLADFIKFWSMNCPHVVTGWNIERFDIPYIVNRCTKLGIDSDLLSPFKKIIRREQTDNYNNSYSTYRILGVAQLDYLELYKKFTLEKKASYKLDDIAEDEVSENKLNFGEYQNFLELYNGDYDRFLNYNMHDVNLVQMIDDKRKLLDLVYQVAYYAGINYVDVMSPVRTWDSIMYNALMDMNIIVPYDIKNSMSESLKGAYVKEPTMGLKRWVCSFDLTALYPSIIIGWNIGSENCRSDKNELVSEYSIVNTNETYGGADINASVAVTGYQFDNTEQSFLSTQMERLFKIRKDMKGKMLEYQQLIQTEKDPVKLAEYKKLESKFNTFQNAMKTLLNSGYGACSNEYFRHFDFRVASSITGNGQAVIKYISERMNKYMNGVLKTNDVDYTVYIDTDSIYLDMESMVENYFYAKKPNGTTEEVVEFLDKVCGRFGKEIDRCFSELKERLNMKKHTMFMDREGIFKSGFWTAKKRYALLCYDMEGVRYNEPKMKIMGMETQRSSTPKICRAKLKDAIKLILTEDNDSVIKYINKFKKEYKQYPLQDIVAFSGCNNIGKYTSSANYPISGCPGHIRGVITYNRLISEDELMSTKYVKISEGDKAMIVHLKQPNPTREKRLSYAGVFPTETGLERYIDKDSMFHSGFKKPLTKMLETIGWEAEHRNTLSAFF